MQLYTFVSVTLSVIKHLKEDNQNKIERYENYGKD
ncbi:MAG: hypothetical protein ACI9WT_000181 [Flavobacterium sp.]|jgi:hypothetical protein